MDPADAEANRTVSIPAGTSSERLDPLAMKTRLTAINIDIALQGRQQ
jgi:hypothetical protein